MKRLAIALFILGIFLFSVVFVSALFYNNVISDEKLASLNGQGITLHVTPLWSAKFQVNDTNNQTSFLTVSFLDVKETTGGGNATLRTTWASNWFYLNDGNNNEYLADNSVIYVNTSASTGVCSVSAPDNNCGINKILLDFNSHPEFQSTTYAYNGFISDISTRDLIANSNFTSQFELIFNPVTGKLSGARYNGNSMNSIKEVGFMSYGEFNLLYGTAPSNQSAATQPENPANHTVSGGSNNS